MLKFYPMHMHLHASHEPTASIGGHMARARALGIRHLWLTEHDVRMGEKKHAITHFSLTEEAPTVKDEKNKAGFRLSEGARVCYPPTASGFALELCGGDAQFFSSGKRHCDPLFSDISVSIEADVLVKEGYVEFDFTLSEQPPHFGQVHLIYTTRTPLPSQTENTVYLPLPRTENGPLLFSLTKDTPLAIGGEDNAFNAFTLRARDGGGIRFYSATFHRKYDYEQVRLRQAALAERLGKKHGVTPFVAFEITGAGQHKNCYSTHVPVIDYRAHGFRVTAEEAIAHVKAHGGIFCYNHPFTPWKRLALDKEMREEILKERHAQMLAGEGRGASLMEVGFPSGKESFPTEYYLRLWDMLAMSGLILSGDGDSDSHSCREEGWLTGNNFVTWVGIPDEEPPSEEAFVSAMVKGCMYMGDPTVMGTLSFTADGAPMGSIAEGERHVRFLAEGFPAGAYARLIVNGKAEKRTPLDKGALHDEFTLCPDARISLARIEIYREDGRLIALTNPVYAVKREEDVPEECRVRLVTKG